MVKEKSTGIKVLFVYKHNRSFVKSDLEVLKEHFEVIPCYFEFRHLFRILLLLLKSDLVFIWFASYHALVTTILAKLFSKKVVVVTGGYDVAEAKEIRYGLMLNPLLKRMVKFVLNTADRILAVSQFTKEETERYCGATKIQVVYNGVDSKNFIPGGKKGNMVLTIGRVKKKGITLKGLETYAKASLHFPDHKFVVIGEVEDSAKNELKKINSNILFTGQLLHEDISGWLQQAKVYCQLSYRESFGMGVAEAMLCGCIPVVTNRGALPEVVGDTGFYVPYGDVKATVEAIKKALNNSEELGKKARKRIITLFSHDRREKRLVGIIEELIGDKNVNSG